jgi:hypothetical protein
MLQAPPDAMPKAESWRRWPGASDYDEWAHKLEQGWH